MFAGKYFSAGGVEVASPRAQRAVVRFTPAYSSMMAFCLPHALSSYNPVTLNLWCHIGYGEIVRLINEYL